jgi:predicted AlkP superfamily phosphohydrolase/phosphomutase
VKIWLALAVPLVLLTGCSRTTGQAASPRMIVLGIDGMDPNFLEAHWSSLPNLDGLRKGGGFRRLGTTVPPQSPVAWSTFATGLDPGGHGVFDFIHRDPATYLPISSMAETTEAARSLTIGPYVLPLTSGTVRSLRAGRTFWQLLAQQGIPASVIRIPANFPPAESAAESLSGMGTPDLGGTFGTFSFFTDDPAETRTQVSGGRILHVQLSGGGATLRMEGPPNTLRRDHALTHAQFTVHTDPSEPVARFDLPNGQLILKQGEWSDWLHARFSLIAGLESVSGIFRLYLQQVHPYFRLYVSPVNIDPEKPEMPLSTPANFSHSLAGSLGDFYTQGIAEETSALRAGILTRSEFLVQTRKILSDSLRMYRYELDHFSGGLLFYYFSSIDQNSHMLWGVDEADILDFYKAMDQAIGEALQKPNTTVLILSDHGFAPFNRAVHLNTWLMQEGFLTLDNPRNTSNEEGFPHMNWDATQAYALGLNGIYVNLQGRESHGSVSPADKRDLLDQIAAKLLAFVDPATGEHVVDKAYIAEDVYRGRHLQNAPDIIVGFRRGYRASWQTALGAVPPTTIEDNTEAWVGDHCMAADEVPGVVLSNRPIRMAQPHIYDVTATILTEFGVPPAQGMLGRPVL